MYVLLRMRDTLLPMGPDILDLSEHLDAVLGQCERTSGRQPAGVVDQAVKLVHHRDHSLCAQSSAFNGAEVHLKEAQAARNLRVLALQLGDMSERRRLGPRPDQNYGSAKH